MNRTRIIFFAIVALALFIVGISFLISRFSGSVPNPTAQPLQVRVVTALSVEPWVQDAATKFNAEKRSQDGRTIVITVTPMDSVTALGKWDRSEFNPVPTVWIPDSRYLVELVNATYSAKLGRDVFLTDGEYRARPLATSSSSVRSLAAGVPTKTRPRSCPSWRMGTYAAASHPSSRANAARGGGWGG